jgi:hypothetical protein
MPLIRLHPAFPRTARKFTKNNLQRSDAVKKAFRLFQENPKHPSLHLEKLSGKDIWTIRIDEANRIFFRWSESGDTAIFFFVGKHDSYKTM